MKSMLLKPARPLGALFAAVLVMTLCVRVGEGVMANTGVLSYSYKLAASPIALDGSLFDKVMVVSSSGTFFGFLVTAAVVVAIAVAFSFVAARAFSTEQVSLPVRLGAETAWGFVAVVVSIICMGIVVVGLFSGTQLSLAGGAAGGGMGAMPVCLLLALSTLLVAGAEGVRFATSGTEEGNVRLVRALIAAVALSAVTAACTAGTFAALNAQPMAAGAASAWLAAATLANLALAAAFSVLGAHQAKQQ